MFQTWNSSKWTGWYHCGKANALTTSPTVWGTELYSQVFSYWPTVGWKYNRNKLGTFFFHVLDFVGLPCVVACVCVCVWFIISSGPDDAYTTTPCKSPLFVFNLVYNSLPLWIVPSYVHPLVEYLNMSLPFRHSRVWTFKWFHYC